MNFHSELGNSRIPNSQRGIRLRIRSRTGARSTESCEASPDTQGTGTTEKSPLAMVPIAAELDRQAWPDESGAAGDQGRRAELVDLARGVRAVDLYRQLDPAVKALEPRDSRRRPAARCRPRGRTTRLQTPRRPSGTRDRCRRSRPRRPARRSRRCRHRSCRRRAGFRSRRCAVGLREAAGAWRRSTRRSPRRRAPAAAARRPRAGWYWRASSSRIGRSARCC